MPHEVDWQGMKTIDRARWKRERKIREAFHIEKRKLQLNRDVLNEAPFGMPLFDFGVGLDTTLWRDCLRVPCASRR